MALLELFVLRRILRLVRRLVVTLVVLAVLAGIGNYALGRYAESRAASQIQTAMKIPATPSVHIDAFPILWWVLKGRLPHVTIDAAGATVRGLKIARFHLVVNDLRASLSDLTSGTGVLAIGSGTAQAETDAGAVNAYLASHGEAARVAFQDGAVRITKRVLYAGAPFTIAATGTLSIAGTDLVFTPTAVTFDGVAPPAVLRPRARRDAAFRVAIPALPGGIRPASVHVTGSSVVLDAVAGRTTLDLGSL